MKTHLSILTLLSLLFFSTVNASTFRSVQTGNWNDASTWTSGAGAGGTAGIDFPLPTDNVYISQEDTVYLNFGTTGSLYEFEGFLQVDSAGTLWVTVGTNSTGLALINNAQLYNKGNLYVADITQGPGTIAPIDIDLYIEDNAIYYAFNNSYNYCSDDIHIRNNALFYTETNVCIEIDDDLHLNGTTSQLCGSGGASIGATAGSNSLVFEAGASAANICTGMSVFRGTGGTCSTGGTLVTAGSGPSNIPPIAINDVFEITQNTSANLNVLYNGLDDSDVDGDTLDILTIGSNLAVNDNTTSLGGTISINDNGTPLDLTDDYIVYTPPTDLVGTDSFQYIIQDEDGANDTATVTLNVGCGPGFITSNITNYPLVITSQTGVNNNGNVTGAPDAQFGRWHNNGDIMVQDFGQIYPAGTQYVVTWRRRNGQTGTAQPVIEESTNNSAYTTLVNAITTGITGTVTDTVIAENAFRYLRMSQDNGVSNVDFQIDAVGINSVNCSADYDEDGIADNTDIDDDNDGVLDVDELVSCDLTYQFSGVLDGERDRGAANNDLNRDFVFGDNFSFDLTFSTTVPVVIETTVGDASFSRSGTVTVGGVAETISTAANNFQTVSHTPTASTTYSINLVGFDMTLTAVVVYDLNSNVIAQFDFGTVGSPISVGYIGVNTTTTSTTIPLNCELDTDNDGLLNRFDLDSDGDGIADLVEAGGVDGDANGKVDVFIDTDNDGWANTFDSDNGGVALADGDQDGDGYENRVDIDSDGDGIVDIIEAQVSGILISPSGVDADNDGVDDNFDEDNGSNLLVPINTDGTDNFDFTDTDADNDGDLDALEAYDTNNDGTANTVALGSDTDGDGLDDNFDNIVGPNTTTNITNNGQSSASFPNLDITSTTERDWREIEDKDGDGIANAIDIDDDNDGILDTEESLQQGILNYEFYDGAPAGNTVANIPTTGALATGTVSDFDVDALQVTHDPGDADNFAIRYTGNITITTAGSYTFYTSSDDGSTLSIDGTQIVNNDGAHAIAEQSGTVVLTAGLHTIEVLFFEATVDESLSVSYEGPSIAKTLLPFSILSQPGNPDTDNDGIINSCDLDSDNDGIADIVEAGGVDANGDGMVDGVFADTDGDGWSNTFDSDNGGVALTDVDTDADGYKNRIDIDSDADGIVDLIEGQASTASPVVPSGTDSDGDGIDNNFDPDSGNNLLTPENTDLSDNPDYIDTDSDNDGISDQVEAYDTDNDGTADVLATNADADEDGLDDGFDAVVGPNSTTNVTNGQTSSSFPNLDNTATPERDWREFTDKDGDLVGDGIDIDDDNDGITDEEESIALNNLMYEFYDGSPAGNTVANIPTTGALSTGVATDFDVATLQEAVDPGDADDYGIRYTGSIFIATAGTYTFTTNSDDGSNLSINGTEIVDNDGLHGAQDRSGTVALTAGFHSIEILFFERGGGNVLSVSYSGPSIATTALPFSILGIPLDNDVDNDGIPNSCDLDSDNDGIADIIEAGGVDANGDGIVDGVFADTDGDGWSNTFDSDNGGTALTDADTDLDGLVNRVDIDSDNDGIVDVIEAQVSTASPTVPSGTDSDGDGIDNNFDPNSGNALLTPINTDGVDTPDYIDTDADNDGFSDQLEAYDTNNDGTANTLAAGTDSDNDGLDDNFDNVVGPNASTNITNSGQSSSSFPNLDNTTTAERDWREIDDKDGDNIADNLDIDDDNDGILDEDESLNLGFLRYEFYDGAVSGSTVANIPTTGALSTGNVSSFDVDALQAAVDPGDANNFSIRFYGTIIIATTGSYTFTTSSDDGSNLSIDGVEIVDNDGAHGIISRSGTVTLSAGAHDIEVLFFENTGGESLTVDYSGPSIATTSLPFSILGSGIGIASEDSDNDGILNSCDLDSDNDGIADIIEAGGVDADGDGMVDGAFADTDGDGWSNTFDSDNGGTALTDSDTDGDGLSNRVDIDSDGDGIVDVIEAQASTGSPTLPSGTDSDTDGIDDNFDQDSGNNFLNPVNTDLTDNPDYLDTDSDNDGFEDFREAYDTDNDGIVNTVASGTDTDADGLDDAYDLVVGPNASTNVTNSGQTSSSFPNLDNASTAERDWREIEDKDGDGVADNIDIDVDNDGILNTIECPLSPSHPLVVSSQTGVTDNGNITNAPDGLYADFYENGDVIVVDMGTVYAAGTKYVITWRERAGQGGTAQPLIEESTNNTTYTTLTAVVATDDIAGVADTVNAENDFRYLRISKQDPPSSTDFEIDGIAILQRTSCDKDGDGVDNDCDLDSDNDGIVDIIEAGGLDADNNGRVDAITDTDGDGFANTFDTDNGGTALAVADFDGDGLANYLDIDSDSDGLIDNVEGQTTATFRVPLNADTDMDGWDNRYDSDNGGTAITISNNEGAGEADYIDINSDSDGLYDWTEGFDDDGDQDALNDLLLRATNFEAAAGNPLFYVNTDDTDSDGIPNWLEDDDGDNTPNFLDPDNVLYQDTDNDGLVDLYDTDNSGTGSVLPDGDGDGEYDFRDPDNQISLPIELLSFTAEKFQGKVKLDWSTITEINNDYFTIERSINGKVFIPITTVQGAGNTTLRQDYIAYDDSPLEGYNYYRLRQTDYDGKTEVFNIEVVYFDKLEADLKLKVFPNPTAGEQLFLEIENPSIEKSMVQLLSQTGKLIKQIEIKNANDQSTYKIEVLHGLKLASGIYNLKYISSTTSKVVRFVVR